MRLDKRRAPVWLALLAAFAMIAAACGEDDGDGAPPPGGGVTGGEFTMAICEPEFLIPQKDNETCGGQVLHTLFSALVEYDAETSEPSNLIAADMTSDDQQTWTISLNDGWTFHDGSPVDAASFVDAWNWAAYGPNAAGNNYFFGNVEGYDELNPAEGKPSAKELSGLEVIDDLTFEATLTAPFSQFPLTVGYNAFYPLPDSFFEDEEAFNEKPIGNGPYMMDGKWRHNQEIRVVKYDDYAGEEGNADAIEFRIYGAEALDTAYRDLQAGNIDLVDSVPPEQIEAAQQEFGDAFIESPSSSFTYLGFPLDDERFQDANLRHALSMAIDREAIIDAIFFGTLTPAKSVVSPVVQGSRDDACGDLCSFDPEAAKAALDEAGGWEGTMKLWFNNDGGHEEWMEAVSNQLRQNLGIESQFESLPFAEYLGKLDAGEVDGPFRLGWVMDYPSPQNYLEPLHGTQGSSNNTGYSNQEVDDLIAEGNAAPSIEEGIDAYNAAEDIILQDMPVIPLWFGLNQSAHGPRIDNVVVDAFSFARLEDVEVVEQ